MRLPPVPRLEDPLAVRYLTDLTKAVRAELEARTVDASSRGYVRLISPDGSVWELSVDDAGLVVTTKVAE